MTRFTKAQRLLKSREFNHVLDTANTKVVCAEFVLVASARNMTRPSRLGLIVSGKVGNAVIRNRIKRSIRSAFQLNLAKEPALVGRDLVVIARPSIVNKKGEVKSTIQENLIRCAGRLMKELK